MSQYKDTVLVSGGAGYIGTHTTVALIEAGYDVVVIDNFFAAYKAVGESMHEPLKYYQNNLVSYMNILQLMKEFHRPNVLFSSSATVYGDAEVLPVTEQTPRQPATSPYGNTKQIAEDILRDCCRAYEGFNGIALRYFKPIGAHPSALIGELPRGVPNNLVPFITQTAAGVREMLSIFGNDYNTPDGTCLRDYIDVVDLAKAHVAAVNRRDGDVPAVWADTTLANNELGWKAERAIEDTLRSAWAWEKRIRGIK